MVNVKLKRIYEKQERTDGLRILVDRLWPRGISKEQAQIDFWLKEIGPTNELRKKFKRGEINYELFDEKYQKELASGKQHEALLFLIELIEKTTRNVTLLYASRNKDQNNAQIIKKLIK